MALTSINKAYPSYKPSGIEWIGEIPEGWDVRRFRFIFSFNNGLNITKENLQDSGVPCVNYGEIHSKYGFEVIPGTHDLKCVDEEYLTSSKKSLLNQGDFIFADTSEDIEGSGNFTYINSNTPAFAGYHTIIARPIKTINSRYLAYLFDSISFRTQIRSEVAGIKVYSITKRIIKNALVLLPPLPEQQAIASFLDRETARINRIIEKQTRLIELLKEKRSALITKAVTRGLDPNAKMKDSGVEWIGEIPEGWEVKRLKYLGRIKEGQVNPFNYEDLILIAPNHIESATGRIILRETSYVQNAISGKYYVSKGSLIYSKIRPNLNKVCIADVDCLCSADMYPIEFDIKQINISFCLYVILSQSFVDDMTNNSMRVAMPKVNRRDIDNCFLPVPSLQEQENIVDYLNNEIIKIDTLISKIGKQIELLNEYKQSLITAAVTGKIDVRNVQ
jgi:type I restriction enzyme S subunit